GWSPIGRRSSFDVKTNPVEEELKKLSALRAENPALTTGWSIVRYAQGSLFVVSRIDPTTRKETVVALNGGFATAAARIATATPSARWHAALGPGGARS